MSGNWHVYPRLIRNDGRLFTFAVYSQDFSPTHEQEIIAYVTLDKQTKSFSFETAGPWSGLPIVPPDVAMIQDTSERDAAIAEKCPSGLYWPWTARLGFWIRLKIDNEDWEHKRF